MQGQNKLLASCPWGPVTANEVDLWKNVGPNRLKRVLGHTKNQARRSIGCGRRGGYTRKEGKLGNIDRLHT